MSKENREWAEKLFIPEDKVNGYERRFDYILDTHTSLLNSFVKEAREEYQKLNMIDIRKCNATAGLDFKNKLMVINATVLSEAYKKPEYQLFYCTGGFGCSPTGSGRKVYGEYFIDGEQGMLERDGFIGEIQEEFLPDWAAEKLKEMQSQEQAEQKPPMIVDMGL